MHRERKCRAVIVVRRPEDAEAWLADAVMCCPRCGGALAKWGGTGAMPPCTHWVRRR